MEEEVPDAAMAAVAAVIDVVSMASKDSGEGGSKGTSEASCEQVVVKDQVKAVVGDLENVLGELKTVVGDLRVLVNQIDVVTSKIDEEYGDEVHTGSGEMRKIPVEKRRRSASLLESGKPKREIPPFVRHSLSQPFDVLASNKGWVFQAPLSEFTSKMMSESPRHSNCYNHKKEKKFVCHAHNVVNAKMDNVFGTPKKDDIIICTPGSLCYKKDHHGTPQHGAATRRKVDLAIYENVPITTCRTPSKSSSNNSRSPRTSNGSKSHSPRTSNSSGIGNSNESGNGNTYNNTKWPDKQRKVHRSSSSSRRTDAMKNTTVMDLTSKPMSTSYFQHCDNHRNNSCVVATAESIGSNIGETKANAPALQLSQAQHRCTVPCSPSPDSDYCGVYERELDLKLELVFEDELDKCGDDDDLDLQSYAGYGSTYDRERVSRWAAYTLVNIGSLPVSSDAETPSETSSDILNDNVFITTAAEMGRRANRPWASVFNRYYKNGLEHPDTG